MKDEHKLKIDQFIQQHNEFIKDWYLNPSEVWKVSHYNNLTSVRRNLEPYIDYLPEPYIGDPFASDTVFLSYNPGPVIHRYQHRVEGDFVKRDKAHDSYSSFAKDIIYFRDGNTFWKPRINMAAKLTGKDEKETRIFGIEICPWHSSGFMLSNRDIEASAAYINDNVLTAAEAVSHHSTNKAIISVGKNYYHLFNTLGLKKLLEIDNNSSVESWPTKKNGEKVIRNISLWQSPSKAIYLNTFSPGSNKVPSNQFLGIIKKILSSY
jgi:hypothetical protein